MTRPLVFRENFSLAWEIFSGISGQTSYPRRHRTYSGTSCRSSLSIRSATSAEDVHLPVPLCRRHSSSNGSINGSQKSTGPGIEWGIQ
ncbi:unnamed protein product [Anisakis simplex]|uniref:Uncharacterized protein n=1 Tax=Anisakis simplex TaxID=6269 RepID=A0A0M3JHJ4_ANISI|nr:unnamed protein product [Anisakis simplex]